MSNSINNNYIINHYNSARKEYNYAKQLRMNFSQIFFSLIIFTLYMRHRKNWTRLTIKIYQKVNKRKTIPVLAAL